MRAFLEADSCPSRCRRSTSCLSCGGTGHTHQDRASLPPTSQSRCTDEETEAQGGQSRTQAGSQVALDA